MTEKIKLFVDISALNDINRAKTEYNQKKMYGALADGYYEFTHPDELWTIKYTITGNHCVCDKYDQHGTHISHSEYTDPDPSAWPAPEYDYDKYEVIDISGLKDESDEI